MSLQDDIRAYLAQLAPHASNRQAAQLLKAALNQLEAQAQDTQRLDWLARMDNNRGHVLLPRACIEANLHSMRAAIDMAMATETPQAES